MRRLKKYASGGSPDPLVPASDATALSNTWQISGEPETYTRAGTYRPWDITKSLRSELSEKGLKGFKKGGAVKKRAVAKRKGKR